jgi:sulfate permease, SulP family
VVIVAGIVARFGIEGLSVTLMAGVLLLIMGITGLGAAVKFIPWPVIIGFTNGIALLIASTQIKDFLGLKTGAVPSSFLPRMKLLAGKLGTVQWQTVAIAGARAGNCRGYAVYEDLNTRVQVDHRHPKSQNGDLGHPCSGGP